ncbi:hypothetical protein [Lederbergia citrea]|uniref:Uncharacterized protein n=1 Tax=Lederbergia citrea TaxID=2833581 RepID=A0A942UL13_9BACI|nr:hypothetical protein [Lederbergia citrea]MBS4223360.1 hypothetical protein [Lederbergia citrea]
MHKKKLILSIFIIILLTSLLLWKIPSDEVENDESVTKNEIRKDELFTQSLYDEWYDQQPTWSIDHFPKYGSDYKGNTYAWGWSYVANSLIDMYEATGQEKYLDLLVPQVRYIFTQTDERLWLESFTNTGLSLPAWSDRGHYTSGEFSYIYPVHTGMIILPVLRFVDIVKENNISKYNDIANDFLQASGEALAIHNKESMWKDISEDEGFYMGHPYGEGLVSEANKIGIPNRIFIYLAAGGLYDKLTGGNEYTERINKSLRYFKHSLVKYDKNYDSYYWSYWNDLDPTSWEDISHAALTVYGIYILHEEAGFSIFTDKDFIRFKNIIYKIVNKDSPPKARKFIHRKSTEQNSFYKMEDNQYYFSLLKWTFLGIYDKKVLETLEPVYREAYNQKRNTVTTLSGIATYLKIKDQLKAEREN